MYVYFCSTSEMPKIIPCFHLTYLGSIKIRLFHEGVDRIICLGTPDLWSSLSSGSIILGVLNVLFVTPTKPSSPEK